jgi:chitosanase
MWSLSESPMKKVFVLALLAIATNAIAGSGKNTIQRLTSIFENGTPVFQYTFAANIGDGRGYTFGFVGFTSGTYSGSMFLEEYRRLRPHNAIAHFLPAFKRIDAGPHDGAGRNADITGLDAFPAAFATCGSDPAFRRAQHSPTACHGIRRSGSRSGSERDSRSRAASSTTPT